MKRELANLQTKTLIANSLKKLMNKKPLSKITITEIIQDCDINRKTFYYHFQDINDLVKWILELEAFNVIKEYDVLKDYDKIIDFTIDYVQENTHIINCAYDSIGRDELKRFFYNDFISLAQKGIEECKQLHHFTLDPSFESFICRFYTEAIAGILVDGFTSKKTPDKAQIKHNVKVIFDSLPDVLRRANH